MALLQAWDSMEKNYLLWMLRNTSHALVSPSPSEVNTPQSNYSNADTNSPSSVASPSSAPRRRRIARGGPVAGLNSTMLGRDLPQRRG